MTARFLRMAGALLALVLVGSLLLTFGRQPADLPVDTVSHARWHAPGGPVTVTDVVLVDTRRPTPANREAPALPTRTLPTRVWAPTQPTGEPHRLLLFSHGFLSQRDGGAAMAAHLAGRGFVVMAPTFPLTTLRAEGGPQVRDVVNQPGDLSFLLDTAAAWNAEPGHALHGRVRTDDVGAFGVSLGGLTSTLAAYHPTLADPRIRHVVSIAGPLAMLAQPFFARQDVDFLMLAGRQDAVVPFAQHAAHTLQRIPGAQLIELTDGSHVGFSGMSGPMRWMHHPDALSCWMLLRRDPNEPAEPWATVLGTPDQGILADADHGLCTLPLTARPLNTLAQQRLTTLVVTAFFESTLSPDPSVALAARAYLRTTLAQEFDDVVVHTTP